MKKSLYLILTVTLLHVSDISAETLNTYFETGKLKAQTNYVDGSRSGNRKGIKNGIEKVYYQMGQLAYQVNYIGGKRDGKLVWYDKKGNKLSEINYDHGKISGVQKNFFAYNEKVKSSVNYKNDKKEGLEKQYYDNGQLAMSVNYIHGKKEGIQREYTYDGKLYSEVTYVNNYKEDMQKWYDKKGNIVKTELYKHDLPVNIVKKLKSKKENVDILIKDIDFSPKKPK